MAGSFADLAALNLSANLSAISRDSGGGGSTQKFDTVLTGFGCWRVTQGYRFPLSSLRLTESYGGSRGICEECDESKFDEVEILWKVA